VPTATPTPPLELCVGDCNGDGVVTVNELVTMVNIGLGTTPVADCVAGDANGDGEVVITEIIVAVTNLLTECPVG